MASVSSMLDRIRPIYIIVCSLFCLFPLGASGQTSAHYVQPHPSDSWQSLLLHGGMRRNAEGWYMQMPNGIHDLLVMNYVDGYSIGPHAIWGHMNHDRSRWELEETIRWAGSRDRMVAKASLRYFWPVEKQRFVSLYGGQHMEDFDEEPAMPERHSLMTSGLFGWNHNKLLERTQAGVRISSALTGGFQLTGDLRWERRAEKENTRWKNIFGTHAESNVPRVCAGDCGSEPILYAGPIGAQLLKGSLQLDLLQHQTLYVMDDMTAIGLSPDPKYSLKVEVGQGLGPRWSEMRFLASSFSMSQSIRLERELDALRYFIALGTTFTHGEVGLADWHHFDASRFWWQCNDGLARFSLLDNYELSTQRWWCEAHAEWSSEDWLLTRSLLTAGARELLQLHAVRVAEHQLHWEGRYAVDLLNMVQLGISVGFNDMKCAGFSLGMILNLEQAQRVAR